MKRMLSIFLLIISMALVSCATKSISETPEYLKNINKNELEALLEYPLCIAMESGVYCGNRNLGSLFVLVNKVLTGKDTSVATIMQTIKKNKFGDTAIQKLSYADTLILDRKERIGDEFYKITVQDTNKGAPYSFTFGVRAQKIYIPYSVLKDIIN